MAAVSGRRGLMRAEARLSESLRRWRAFAGTAPGARLVPLYATLLGAAGGALVGDQIVRLMWRHAIFTGVNQWRTAALGLVVLWIAIGAVTAVALLGADGEEPDAPTDATDAG